MIVCSACGQENAASFDYCLGCGHELRESTTESSPSTAGAADAAADACATCGQSLGPGSTFCGACGTRVGSKSTRSGTVLLSEAPGRSVRRPALRLVNVQPDGSEGGGYPLDSEEAVAGASAGEIRFADDPFVSPRHCRFFWVGDALHVEDLGSQNGVFRRLRNEAVLRSGDHVRLGRQLLRIEPMGISARVQIEGTKFWGSPDPGYEARLLQLLQGGSIGEVFPLRAGENLIGREAGDVTFPTDRFVSGRHAVVKVEGENYVLRDVGSSNGTFVRITGATPLQPGDLLLVGNQLLRLDAEA